MKKCVVIGSGLGGLSCGAILAKNGYDVTVLEQGNQIGGCLQCFHRGDAVFDTGMHYVGSGDKGQILNTIFHYLGVDKDIKLSRLNPKGYDVISLRGEHYRIANGRDEFINALTEHFPKSAVELNTYYDLIKLVAASLPMHSLNKNADMNVYANYLSKSVNEVIDGIISDPLLREVLVGVLPLYAGEKNRTPFTNHALITDYFNQSAFRIVGGSSVVADSLADVIRKNGGKILLRTKASKIETNETEAKAVITADGDRISADIIVSAIHPASTLNLVDSHLIRAAYRSRIENYRNTVSAFTVYLKFHDKSVRYMDSNLYYYRGSSTWGSEIYDAESWPKSMLYMHFCHEQNPEFAQTGQILTYMNFDDTKKWLGTHVGNRGTDYESFKREKAEIVINALEKEVPGLRDKIEDYYTSTPLTYLDYTGVPDGAMYGIAKDVNVFGSANVSCKTSIPNLLLTGQCLTLHGMLGVLVGSLITCSELLTRDEIFRQLDESMQ